MDRHSDEVILYEPCKGVKINVRDGEIYKYVKIVHCLFNHTTLYALNQKTDDVCKVDQEITDAKLWQQQNWDQEDQNKDKEETNSKEQKFNKYKK